MKLEKAIEILDDNVKAKPPGMNHDYFDALKLGIEAMKRLLAWRNDNDDDYLWDLPGETED